MIDMIFATVIGGVISHFIFFLILGIMENE